MKVNYDREGIIEFTSERTGITFSLTESEAWEIHHIMELKKYRNAITYAIEDFVGWYFEQTQNEVLNNNDLMDDMIEYAMYNEIDFNDDCNVCDLLESHLDIKYEEEEE